MVSVRLYLRPFPCDITKAKRFVLFPRYTVFRCVNKCPYFQRLLSTDTLTQTTKQMLQTFERKILRRIYGPTQEEGRWCPRWNNELYMLYKDLNILELED